MEVSLLKKKQYKTSSQALVAVKFLSKYKI